VKDQERRGENMTTPNDAAEPSPASAGSVANRQATLDGWIPVAERLPAKDLMVLVWSQSNGIHLAYIDPWGQWRDADENFGKKITHWMPLPAPPTARK
jgi:hypothetical protein